MAAAIGKHGGMKNPIKLRAVDLKKEFAVYGHFYQLAIGERQFSCRSLLELVAFDSLQDDPNALQKYTPDLLVVMMNPGSSRPLDHDYRPVDLNCWSEITKQRQWVATRPDNTQYQIMRIMVAGGYKHARIFNLSDLREPKSPLLFKKIAALAGVEGGGVHSIFSPERQDELNGLLGYSKKRRPLLVGWGRDVALLQLANLALERFKGWSIYGKAVDEDKVLFSHPSPMLQSMKEQWVRTILTQMSADR